MPYTCPINGKGATLKLTNLQKEDPNPSIQTQNNENSDRHPPTTPKSKSSHINPTEESPLKIHHQTAESPKDPNIKHRSFYIFNENDDKKLLQKQQDINEQQQQQQQQQQEKQTQQQQQPRLDQPIPQTSTPFKSPNRPRSSSSTSPGKPLSRSNSRKKQMNAGGISKLSLNLNEILKFPKESTHAYSYAHLSPNSLAVRLSVLKRSLEILVDRPDLLQKDSSLVPKNGEGSNDSNGLNHPLHLDIASFINQIHNEDEKDDDFKIQSNASSAALAALFNSTNSKQSQSNSNARKPSQTTFPNNTHLGLKALIRILQEDKSLRAGESVSSRKELAMNLHDLSLSNVTDDNQPYSATNMNRNDSESQLKIKLLHALATPFYEPIVSTPIISLQNGASTLALSSLNQQQAVANAATSTSSNASNNRSGEDRIFHSMSQKNTSPQAVFTVEFSSPWKLKAANDLACLIFGVSRNSLKRLTLLDLISPDSRDFVLNRLLKNSMERNQEMIFSGQVVAIAKPGNKLTWASLWAKRKGNLIICMFDQVPCDSIDFNVYLDDLKIESYKKISGNSFFNNSFLTKLEKLDQLIHHISEFTSIEEDDDNNVPKVLLQTQSINSQRYFTLRKNGFNIPCALFANVVDEALSKVKLKIHSLPYIAGVFIISNKSPNYNILSFNESIAKNLFGFHESQLKNQPITKIIPNFKNILEIIMKNFKNLKFIPGLVLPEHFFRQMNSILENKTEEYHFLNSIGIDGKHVDGSTIKIDVQLRCSNVDTLILWITHSRTVYQTELNSEITQLNSKQEQSQVSSSSSSLPKRPTMKKTKSVRKVKIIDNKEKIVEEEVEVEDSEEEEDDDDDDETKGSNESEEDEIPSQLSILNENEIQSVSRSSSLRSSNVTSSSDLSTLSSAKNDDAQATNTNESGDESVPELSEADLENFKVLSTKMDEAHLLKLENETIEKNKSISKYYPKKIGLLRREKSINEFKILKNMGQGAYGKVVLAEYRKDSNYRIVIKLIIKERILVDTWVRDRKLGTIPSEIQIMSTLNNNPHPNIMRLIDFFEDDGYYYIETPQHGFPSPGIDLFDLIELKKSMTEVECKSIIKQCISAINHLHNNEIVHRDLKDENLIIDNNGVIKLIDFGSAAYVKTGPFDVFVGTLDYAAPEVLNGLPYEGKPQDVWSLGILFYTLIYKENPFYNVDEIMEGELRIPFVTSQGCIDLIKRILQRDIKKRPTMQDIVNDSWLNE